MRGVLIRNKELLQQVLANLPIASSTASSAASSAAYCSVALEDGGTEEEVEIGAETSVSVSGFTLTVPDLVEAMKRTPPPAGLGDAAAASYAVRLFGAVMAERPCENVADICDRIDAKLWEMSSEESPAPERYQAAARSLTAYYAERAADLHAALEDFSAAR
jgi:hypothetical protein